MKDRKRLSQRIRCSRKVGSLYMGLLFAVAMIGCSDSEADDLAIDIQPEQGLDLDNLPEVEFPEIRKPADAIEEVREAAAKRRNDADANTKATASNESSEPTQPEEAQATSQTIGDDLILSLVDNIDDAAAEKDISAGRDGHTRNESNELVTLDTAASTACGNVEVALAAAEDGDPTKASDKISEAVSGTASSRTAGIPAWSSELEKVANSNEITNSDSASILVAFLTACTDGGYEV